MGDAEPVMAPGRTVLLGIVLLLTVSGGVGRADAVTAEEPAPWPERRAPLSLQHEHDQGRQQDHGHQHDHGQRATEVPPTPEEEGGEAVAEALEQAANPHPEGFPHPVMDDAVYVFARFDQLEGRFADDDGSDRLGWEAQGWVGGDLHKLWWKSEGSSALEGRQTGEHEVDILYSRRIRPFWSLQGGAQRADEWGEDEDDGRWSAVVAIQGLAPYRFELDASLYLSLDGDVTAELESEYDLRLTQRHVLQPRLELAVSAQDVVERRLGAGLTSVGLDLRWRYEIRRELAPYVGLGYHRLLGETEDLAETSGEASDELRLVVGVRLAL